MARGRLAAGDIDLPLHQVIGITLRLELIGDQRLKIGSRDVLLAVGQLEEAQIRRLQLLVIQLEAQLVQRILEAGAAGVLADDRAWCPPSRHPAGS